MARMVRKQIYLQPETNKRLLAEARRRKVSQAQVIRERIDAPNAAFDVAIPNPKAREELLQHLLWVNQTAGTGPGTGWKFNREELYEERLEKARPTRHQRARDGDRPAGGR